MQFRVDAFDVFNHPNFGPPGNLVGTPTFGKGLVQTLFPLGDGVALNGLPPASFNLTVDGTNASPDPELRKRRHRIDHGLYLRAD